MLDTIIVSGYVVGIVTLIIGVIYGIYKELKGD